MAEYHQKPLLCAVEAFDTREIGDLPKGSCRCPSSGPFDREDGQADGSMSLDERIQSNCLNR